MFEVKIQRLSELATVKDKEIAHAEADEILCEALRELGQHELVNAYEKVGKWYA